MAFNDIRNVKKEIEKYLIKHDSRVDDPSRREMLEYAYNQVLSSLEFSRRMFSKIRKPAEILVRAVYELRGELQSLVSKPTDPRSESTLVLEKKIHHFTQTMKKLERECAAELYNSLSEGVEEEEEEAEVISSKLVGFSDQYNNLKHMLTDIERPELTVFSLTGMPGIGKTALATKIFEDPAIVKRFEGRVWVKVGRNCGVNEVLRRILIEVSPEGVKEDEDIVGCLIEFLKGKTYLIVLDDVWDRYMARSLKDPVYTSRGGNQLRHPFPDEDNGSRLLVISRMEQEYEYHVMNMQLMNKEESWDLLREKLFAQESCPYQLETVGRKIAEKCEGLPLTIVTVAKLLSKQEKTVEYWNEVATKKRHELFKAAYDEILKVLLPSYNYLPLCLQRCFMYIGMFPQYYEVSRSRLINLWMADGFLELDKHKFPLEVALECLDELVRNNMLMIKKNINPSWSVGQRKIKTCRLHTSLLHLSNREARISKFSHVLDSVGDGFGEDVRNQRRLSFHNNVLFAIKVVHKSVEENCAFTTTSLLCVGPYLPYQVPLCFGLTLLNKLDALTIRLYEFPKEVLQLAELRYLALTLNGNLRANISQLSKLQFLIVHPHQSIKSSKESSYLPMEIWKMKEVQHLEVTGKDLPNPCGASLESLSTLSRVSPSSCTVEVFKAIPNLKKLGIQVELSHESDGEQFSILAHVTQRLRIDSLKCVVVNPMSSMPSLSPLSSYPTLLSKLSLEGLGYAWEEMSKIGSLKYLGMLKLRNYAFRGPEWVVGEKQFPRLSSLIIEDTDLERWRIGKGNLRMQRLILKGCYKLKEVHGRFGIHLTEIEMADCNPVGAEQMKKATDEEVIVKMSCSWYDEKKANA